MSDGNEYLSCQQVAQLLHVSPSTVKRMCGEDQLVCVRTPGGHRRIERASVERFIRETGSQVHSTVVARRRSRKLLEPDEVIKCLLKNQVQAVIDCIESQRRLGKNLAEICDGFLAPVMWRVGDNWSCGKIDVSQERRCVNRMREVIFRIRDAIPPALPNAPKAIGGSLEGDPYDLASLMIKTLLRDMGWDVELLGCHIPVSDYIAATKMKDIALVWTSYSYISDPSRMVSENHALFASLKEGTCLVIGGAALQPSLRRSMRFHFAGDSLTHLQDYLLSQKQAA